MKGIIRLYRPKSIEALHKFYTDHPEVQQLWEDAEDAEDQGDLSKSIDFTNQALIATYPVIADQKLMVIKAKLSNGWGAQISAILLPHDSTEESIQDAIADAMAYPDVTPKKLEYIRSTYPPDKFAELVRERGWKV